VLLPTIALMLFAGESYLSMRMNREAGTTRYQWWSEIRLDTTPSGQRQPAFVPCKQDPKQNCAGWGPVEMAVDAGWLAKALVISAVPAFIAGAFIVRGLGHLGINEVWTFAVSMPLLIAGWFYLIGWVIDRWRYRRAVTLPDD